MEKYFTYTPENVCSRSFKIGYEGNKITSFEAVGGCNGNLQGAAMLLKGMDIDDAISRLDGITCRAPMSRGFKTSCPDQIAQALKALKKEID